MFYGSLSLPFSLISASGRFFMLVLIVSCRKKVWNSFPGEGPRVQGDSPFDEFFGTLWSDRFSSARNARFVPMLRRAPCATRDYSAFQANLPLNSSFVDTICRIWPLVLYFHIGYKHGIQSGAHVAR